MGSHHRRSSDSRTLANSGLAGCLSPESGVFGAGGYRQRMGDERQLIRYHVDGKVGVITIDRPEKRTP